MTPEQNALVKSLSGKQEIFDHVVKHLKEQGCQSILEHWRSWADPERIPDGCAYRGSEARMCAIGCLIADDEYDPHMEGLPVGEIDGPRRFRHHRSMLEDLQRFHDDDVSWDSRMGGFSEIGEIVLDQIRARYGLKKPEA